MRAGARVSASTRRREREAALADQPEQQRRSTSSRPIMPGDASANSQSFSSGECGAWSVAMQSMVPSASASRSASTSSSSRSGGFTLQAVS